MSISNILQTAFSLWILGKEKDSSLKIAKDWKKTTKFAQNMADFGKPGMLLAIVKETVPKLKEIARTDPEGKYLSDAKL